MDYFLMMIVDLRTEFWDVLLTTHTVLSIGWLARHAWLKAMSQNLMVSIYDYMYVWNYRQHIIWSISHPLAVHTTHINTPRTNPTHMGAFENG